MLLIILLCNVLASKDRVRETVEKEAGIKIWRLAPSLL